MGTGFDHTRSKEKNSNIDSTRLAEVEKMVTEYIQKHFEFSVIEVKEKIDRVDLESKIISTISRCDVQTIRRLAGLSFTQGKNQGKWSLVDQ
jgi:hypothetical protein